MKIYSRRALALAVASFALALKFLLRNRGGFDLLMAIGWALIGGVHLYRSINEEWAARARASEERISQAARSRFGRWAWPARLFGVGLAVLGIVLILARRAPMACLALILAGVAYTLVLELWLKRRADED